MANKKLKARIQLKHDTEANWNAASTFAPLPGEVIVFEPDDTHEYSRFKVGRKKSDTENHLLSELPFQLSSRDQLVGTDGITIDKSADSETIEISGKNFVQRKSQAGEWLYGTIGQGLETTWHINSLPAYGELPLYSTNKTLKTETPQADNDAANKKFVEDNFVKDDIPGKNITGAPLVPVKLNGKTTYTSKFIRATSQPAVNGFDLIGYDGQGAAYVPNVANNDRSITNKKFVEDAIKAAGTNNLYEANLRWGGKNLVASYSPTDAAMIPVLGANRFAGLPAEAVTVEYSRDGGSTWIDYKATDVDKKALFTTISSFTIGKNGDKSDQTNYQLRITVESSAAKIYTVLNKIAIFVGTEGSTGSYFTLQCRTKTNHVAESDTWDTIVDKTSIDGWTAWNIINIPSIIFGNRTDNIYQDIRFIFGCTGRYSTSYNGLTIYKIYGYGGVGWQTPSPMADHGTPYNYDYSGKTDFPYGVTSAGKELALKADIPSVDQTYSSTSSKAQSGKAVAEAISRASTGTVQYLGTVNSATELADLTPAKPGDFCRVATSFGDYHLGDLLLCKTIKSSDTAATWDVIHGENLSDYASLSKDNTFTGNNTFNKHIGLVYGPEGYIDFGNNNKFYGYYWSKNGYSLDIPTLTKNDTVALKSEIPDTSNFATLSGNNKFTGVNAFKNNIYINGVSKTGLDTGGLVFSDESMSTYTWYLGNRWVTYSGKLIELPTSASGTLALKSDIPDTDEFAKLDGTQAISVTDKGVSDLSGSFKYSGITFTDPVAHNTCLLSAAGLNNTKMSSDGQITLHNTSLMFEDSGLIATINVPNKSGTIALTSDIPNTSTFVKLSDSNMFSGSNIFTSGQITVGGIGVAEKAFYNKSYIKHSTSSGVENTFNFPSKSAGTYTLATTGDIPTFSYDSSTSTLSITLNN